MPDISKFELPTEQLRWHCDPNSLGFTCTDELAPPAGFIGQDRAVAAMSFGLGLDKDGFNIFVTGPTGTGRTTAIKTHLEDVVKKRAGQVEGPTVYDWGYVFNFQKPEEPAVIRMDRGEIKAFANDISDLFESLRKELQTAFTSDSYKEQAKTIGERLNEQRQQIMRETERRLRDEGFAMQSTARGLAVIPVIGGRPVDQETVLKMSDRQREELERRREEVGQVVEQALQRVQELEAEYARNARELDRGVAERAVSGPFKARLDKYQQDKAISQYLGALREYTMQTIPQFFTSQESDSSNNQSGQPMMPLGPGMSRDPSLPFQVNAFVDNSSVSGPPVIVEENPTYANLFGQIERRPVMGTYVTNHMMVHPGSVANANGGYLVVRARDLFRHPGVWEGLKRVVRSRELRTEDPADLFWSAFMPQGLRPQPIPIDVKVVMTGDAAIYHLLSALDEEFWEIFKVRADFDFQMNNTADNIAGYASLICGMVNTYKLRHFEHSGVAAILEYGAREVADREKLSTRFGQLKDLLIEAAEWADEDGSDLVQARHVEKAIEQRIYRASQIADHIQEMMVRGTLMVDLEGAQVGQVNGLAVYALGDISFGKPARITATTFLGRPGVINIEREAHLSGSTHDKGVLILSGYLGRTYAQNHPLNVAISIAFEQSYSGVDGDSASSTELYAILSSLSDLPLKQSIAVTGSVNQLGQIQPIGGVNEKIEGFYDVCREAEKLGPETGVMIPAKNASNLMLRPDVVKAVNEGQFRIYAVSSINEGIEILTGKEAGVADAEGNFPEDTVNGLVAKRLEAMAEAMRQFQAPGSNNSGAHNGGEKSDSNSG